MLLRFFKGLVDLDLAEARSSWVGVAGIPTYYRMMTCWGVVFQSRCGQALSSPEKRRKKRVPSRYPAAVRSSGFGVAGVTTVPHVPASHRDAVTLVPTDYSQH